jgi:DNA-binding HxlR family transcriptional regulator
MNQPGVFRPNMSAESNFTIVPNSWIRATGLQPIANFLLIYFLTHEPGYELRFEQIERETGIGRHALRSALKNLQEHGWLVLERPQLPNGQLGAYRYTLTEARGQYSTVEHSTVEDSTVENQPHYKKQIQENKDKEDKDKESSSFDEFWDIYPLKRDKQAAERAWRKALRMTPPERIIAAARAYRDDPERKPDFTKYPATWLNAGAWENDYTPASEERRQRIEEELAEYRAEQRRLEEQSSPPPKCPHGNNIARCLKCLYA